MKKYTLNSHSTRVFNFYPGPSMLPISVLEQISKDLFDWKRLGINPMEIGHRTLEFIEIYQNIVHKLKKCLNISDDYEILLMQGGATLQYAAIPFNLLLENKKASYIHSGHWSDKARKECIRIFGSERIELASSSNDFDGKQLPEYQDWQVSKDAAYVYFTANETIDGLAYLQDPNESLSVDEIRALPPLVCDATSSLLTQPINVDRYGLIFASAQKCLGIAGVTLVIVRKDLLKQSHPSTPLVLDYKKQIHSQSMLNTPATFSWYVMDLILDWVIQQGGIKQLFQKNIQKANLLYDFIDGSDFYFNSTDKKYRSNVNICFKIQDSSLEAKFVKKASKVGLLGLKGHRVVGGLRASLYNAMPLKGASSLVEFMKSFEKKYG